MLGQNELVRRWAGLVKLRTLWLAHLCLLTAAATVQAAGDGSTAQKAGGTPWYQVVSGIIAIPIALLGGYYTWKQIKGLGDKKKGQDDKRAKSGGVRVAEGARIEGSKVGDIVGVKSVGSDTPPEVTQKTEVLNKGQVKNSEIGDVAGVKHQAANSEVDNDKGRANTSK